VLRHIPRTTQCKWWRRGPNIVHSSLPTATSIDIMYTRWLSRCPARLSECQPVRVITLYFGKGLIFIGFIRNVWDMVTALIRPQTTVSSWAPSTDDLYMLTLHAQSLQPARQFIGCVRYKPAFCRWIQLLPHSWPLPWRN
jgi:hypothetical protein